MAEERIRAAEISINDLFGEKYLFEVPDYQRPFVWSKENFEQLFDDLKSEIDKNEDKYQNNFASHEPYFLGSIVLYQKELRSNGYGNYEIIDGRQRLVSTAILMAVIRDLANGVGNERAKNTMQQKIYQEENEYEGTLASVRIKVKESEREFFKKYILELGGTSRLVAHNREAERELKRLRQKLNQSESRMFDAIEVFREKFYNSQGSIDELLLNKYIKYLLQKVFIVAVKTDSLESAFRLFKTLNKRGVEIGSADILKSENLSAISSLDRQNYATKWEDIEEDITTETNIKLETLINFIRIIEIPGRQQRELFQDFEDKYFKDQEGKKGQFFIDYLSQVKEIYVNNIENCEIFIEDSSKKIYYYNLMSIMRKYLIFNDWMASVIQFIRKYQEGSALFEFVRKLERVIYADWLTGATQERRVARIYQIVKIISDSEKSEEVIKNPIFNDDLKGRKIDFEKSIDDISFYERGSGKLARYTLLRLDMERSDNRNKKIDYDGDISVEHILPENPKDSYWLTRFSEEQRVEWTDRLGNLTLLNGRKNGRAANKPFPEKKEYFFQRRLGSRIATQKSSFELTNELQDFSDWTLESLSKRHQTLIQESKLVWMK